MPNAIEWQSSLTSATTTVVTFVPRLLAFLAILVIGWFVAKALAKVVDSVLERVGFDRAVERGGVRDALARSKYDASDIVAKLVYYAVLLFVLQLAFGVFGPNPVSVLLTGVIAFLPKIFVAIVIVVVTAAIANAVKDLIVNALSGLSYGKLLGNVAYGFILALGVIAALNQIEVATTVTTPILIAVLATVGGILVIGVGGGLIGPMSARWDQWLSSADQHAIDIREQARANREDETSPMSAGGMDRGSMDRGDMNRGGMNRGGMDEDALTADTMVGGATAGGYAPPNEDDYRMR